MSEPDFRQMGDPLNDRLPPRRQWLQAGAPNYPLARDDYHPNGVILRAYPKET